MDDLHDELVKAYLDYFKANEAWEQRKSVRKYYAVQKAIRQIRKLAKERNEEIREHYYVIKKESEK